MPDALAPDLAGGEATEGQEFNGKLIFNATDPWPGRDGCSPGATATTPLPLRLSLSTLSDATTYHLAVWNFPNFSDANIYRPF